MPAHGFALGTKVKIVFLKLLQASAYEACTESYLGQFFFQKTGRHPKSEAPK